MLETIIVLEDSLANREIVVKLLGKLGFNAIAANNGEEGFACIERCERENLNLVAIICDIFMPLVDGPDFVFRLREEPRYETLPVLFMTSATDKATLSKVKKLMAVGYILKPVDPARLATQLKEIFPDRQFPA